MSLNKLKRDLISCGKDFFIDNYFEIKRYQNGEITKDVLSANILLKGKWKDISTLDNRISTVKMIIENNLLIDALKITISSRAKGDVTNKAKEIFETILGRSYNSEIDKIDSTIDVYLIPEILVAIDSKIITELCLLDDFRFQKGIDKLLEFEKSTLLTEIEINNLLTNFKKSTLTVTKFIETLNNESNEFKFIKNICELISYCDESAPNKNLYNEYEDKRTLAKCGVWPDDWVKSLLNYKINKNNEENLTPIIKNAFRYLKNPSNELTMLSEKHKSLFSINILKNNYVAESFVDKLKEFFEPYNIVVENELNRTSVYCSILYLKEVKGIWQDNNSLEKMKSN